MRVDADAGEGELRHVGLGHDHRAGGAQTAAPPVHRRKRRRLLGQHPGAGPRRLSGDVEQVLEADDHAVERAQRGAGAGTRIGRVGSRARRLGIDREARARALAARIGDSVQRCSSGRGTWAWSWDGGGLLLTLHHSAAMGGPHSRPEARIADEWLPHPQREQRTIMRQTLIIAAAIVPLLAAPSPAHAQSTTLTGAAVGLGTGAVIAGPPGALVGGIVGGVIGASAERPRYVYGFGPAHVCWRDRRGIRHCRWR